MTFPLSKDEMKTLSELKGKLSTSPFFSDKEYQLYKDALSLMVEGGFIQRRNSMERTAYVIVGDADVFDRWVKKHNIKAKKLSRREWRIAVTAAIAGALVGLVPTIIRLILNL